MLAALLVAAVLPSQNLRRTPVVEVVEKAGPCVVNLSAEIVEASPFRRQMAMDDVWREFFNVPRRQETAQSLGSGVIIDKSGLILTNEHVVSRAAQVTVTLGDRRTLKADVVAADPAFDIAVLRVRTDKELPAVPLGASNDLMPGETVVAIGNPFGLANTVTTGVVSALHRSIQAGERVYEDFIQTDAAINPGNSGGALLNIEGKLIGINTAIYSGGTGIGFAIPIDRARAVVDEVLRYGEVRPAFLGLDIEPRSAGGALVKQTEAGGAGDAAGIVAGDLIIDVGGSEVRDAKSFAKILRSLIPGQDVPFQINRGGKIISVKVKVRELSPERAIAVGRQRLGLEAKPGKYGMVITAVRSSSDAERIGIKKGDVILRAGDRKLESQQDFDALCAAIRDADAVGLIIGRGGHAYYVTLRLG